MDQELKELIQSTSFLSSEDKAFLTQKLSQMSPLEKLKLRHSLNSGQAPAILQSLQVLRAKFFEQENPPQKKDLLTKVLAKVKKNQAPKVLSYSFLSQSYFLGGKIPKAPTKPQNPGFVKIEDFHRLDQFYYLEVGHITFNYEGNSQQIFYNFLEKISSLFDKISDLQIRRSFLIAFLQSNLFKTYLNTGITALRHPELEPRDIVLNTLYQIDNRYLNSRQFKLVNQLVSHIRFCCGL